MESDKDGQDKELESDIKTEPLEIGIGNNSGENSYVEIMFGPEPPFLPEHDYSLSNKISGEEQNLQSNTSSDVNHGSVFSLVYPTRNINENVQNDSVTEAWSHKSGLLTLTKSYDVSNSTVHDNKCLASADGTDISEIYDNRKEPCQILTETDDVMNFCAGSSLDATNVGSHSEPRGLESVNRGVVTADRIRIKTEPEMDGYADPKQMSEPEETKSLFVSTEHGQMFLQSEPVKLSQNDNQETRVLIRSKKNDKFVCKRRKNRRTLKSFGMRQKTVEELGKMDTGLDVSQQETQISPWYHLRENAKIDRTEQKQIDKADEETPNEQTLCCPKKVPRIAANNTSGIRGTVASGSAVSSTSGKFLIKETVDHTSADDTLIDAAFIGFEDDISSLDKAVRGIIEEEITRLSSKNDKADQCEVKKEPGELTNGDVTERSSAVSTHIGSSPDKTLLYPGIKRDVNALSDEKEVRSPKAEMQATVQKNSNPIPVACIRNENFDPEIQATDSIQNVRDDCNDSNEGRGGNYILQELKSDQPVKRNSVGQIKNDSVEQEDIKCVNRQAKVKLIKVANTNCQSEVKVMKFGGNVKLVKIAKESTLSPQNQNSKHHIYSLSSDQKHLVSHQKNGDHPLYSKSVNVKQPNAIEQTVINLEATTEKPDHMVPLSDGGVSSFSTATPGKRTVYLHPSTGKTYKKVTLPEEGTRSPASTATPATITVYRDHSTGKFYDTSTQPGYRVDGLSSAISNAGKRKIMLKSSAGKTYHMVPLSKEGVRSPPSSACATKNTVSLSRESVRSPSSRPCTMENTVSMSEESAGTPSSSPCTMKGTKVNTDHTPVHGEKLLCPVGNSAAKEAVVCMDPSGGKADEMVSILQNKVNSPSVPASTKSVTWTKLEPVQARWDPVKPTIVRLTPVNQSSVKPVLVLKTPGVNTILNKAVPAQTSVKQTQEKPVPKPSDTEMGWEKTPQENRVKMILISDTSSPLQKIVAPQIGTLRLKGLPLMETVFVMVKDMWVQTDKDDLNSGNDSRDLSNDKVSMSLTENTLSSPTSIEKGCTKSVAMTTSSVTASSGNISCDKSECVEHTKEDVDLIMDVEEAEDVDSDNVGDQLNAETFQDSVSVTATESQNIEIDKNRLSTVKIQEDCRRKFTKTGLDLLTGLRARVRKRYHWRNLDTRSCGVNTGKTGGDDAVVTRELFNTIIGSKYYSYTDLYRNLKTYSMVPDKQKQRKRCVQKFIRRNSFLLEQKKLYEDKLQKFKERCGNETKTAKTTEQTSESSASAATGNETGLQEKMAAAPGRISGLHESMETDMAKFFDDSAMLKDLEEIGTTDYESDSSDDGWKVVIENKIGCDEQLHASSTINSETHSSLLCDSSREIITMNEVRDNLPIKEKDPGKINDDVIKDYCHNLDATEVNSKEKDKDEETMCEEFNEKLCLNLNRTHSSLYSTLCEIEEQANDSDHFTDTISEKYWSCLPQVTHKSLPEVTPKSLPEVTPKSLPEVTHKSLPEVTHKSLPTQSVNILDNSTPVLEEASCRQLLKHSPEKPKSQMIQSQFRSEVKSKPKSPDIIIRSPPKSPVVKSTAVSPEIIVRSSPKSPEIKSLAGSPQITIGSPLKSLKVITVPESVEVTGGSQSVSPEIKSTEISFRSPLKSPSVKSSVVSTQITCGSQSVSPEIKSTEISFWSPLKSPSVKSSVVSPQITCGSQSVSPEIKPTEISFWSPLKSPMLKTSAVSPEITCKSTSKTTSIEISLWSPLKSPFVKTPAVYSEIMIGSPPESPNTKYTEVSLGSRLKSPMVNTSAVSPEILIGSSPQSQTTKSLMEPPDVESRNLVCWSPLTAPDISPLPKSPDVTSKSLFDDEFTSESPEDKSRFRSVEVTFWSPLRSPAVKLPSTTSDINPVTLPEITFRVPPNSLGIKSTPSPQEMNFKSSLKSPEISSKSPHKSPEITFRSPLKSPEIESGPLSLEITFRSPQRSPEMESGAISPEITFRSTLQSPEIESGPLSPEITFRSPLKSPEMESGAVSPEVTFRSPLKSPEMESGAVSPEVTFRSPLKSPEIESGPLSPYIAFKSPLKSSEIESAALSTEISFSSPNKTDEIESGPLSPDVTFRSALESHEIESRQLSVEITFRSPTKSPETKSTLVPPEIIFLSPCKSLKIKSKALQNIINKSSHTSQEIRSILLSPKIKDVRLPSSRYSDFKEERFSKVAWSQKGKCGLANFTVLKNRDEIKEVDLNNNEKPVSVPTFPCDSSKPHRHTDSDNLFVDVKPLDLSVSRSFRACDKGYIEGLYGSQKQPDVLGAPVNLLKQLEEYTKSQTDNKRIDPDAIVETCSMDNTVRRKRKGSLWSTEQFQVQKKCKRPELKTKYMETIQVSATEYGRYNQASGTRHGPSHQVSGTEPGPRHQVSGTEPGPRHQVSGTEPGPRHQISGTEHGQRHQINDTEQGQRHQFIGTKHDPRCQVSDTGHGPRHQVSGTEHGPWHQVNCTGNGPIQQVTCTGNGPGHQFIGTKHGSKHHVIGTDHGHRREVNGSRNGPIHLFSSTENTTRHQASNDHGHQASFNAMFEAKRQERDLMYQLYSSELSCLQSNYYPQMGNSMDKTSDSTVMRPLFMHQGSNPVRDNWGKDNSNHCPLTTMPDMHEKLSYPLQHKLPYTYQENHSLLVDKNGNIVNTIDIQGQNRILQGQSHILTTDQYCINTAEGHHTTNACTLDQDQKNFSEGQGQASAAEGQGQDAVYCDKVNSLQHPNQFTDVTFQGQSNDLPLDLSVSNRCQRVPCTGQYQHSSASLDINKCSGTTENSIYSSHGDRYNTQFDPVVNSFVYRIPQIHSDLRLQGNVPELLCQRPLPLPGCITCNDLSVAVGNVPTIRRPVIGNPSEVTRARLRSKKCGHHATSVKEKDGRNCTKKQRQRKGRKQKLMKPCLEHTQEAVSSQYNTDRLVQDKITKSTQSKVCRSNKVSVNVSPAMLNLGRSCSDLSMSDPQRKSCCDTSGSTGSCSVLHPSCSETVTREQNRLESLNVPGNGPFRSYKVDNGTVYSKEPSHLWRSAMPGSLDDHGEISVGELGLGNVTADNGKSGLTSFHSVVGENITAKKSIDYRLQMAYPDINIPQKYCEMSLSKNQKLSTKDVSTSEMIQDFVTSSFSGNPENGFSRNSDQKYSNMQTSSSAGQFLTPLSQNLAPAYFRMLGLAGQSYAPKDTDVESGRELSVAPNVEPRTHFNENISITLNKNHIMSMASAGSPRLSERINSCRNLFTDSNRMYEMMLPVDSSKALNSRISEESTVTSGLSNISKIDAVGHPGDSSRPGRLCTCTSKSRTPCTVSSCIVLAANRAMTTEHPVSHDRSRKGTDQQETDLSEHCCSCSSRGKCRSCVCCKTGCYNCRNKLCCFKDKGVYVFPLPLKNATKNRRSRTKKSALARKKEKTDSHESSKASSEIGQRIVDQSNRESLTPNFSAPCVMDRLCEKNNTGLSSVIVEHHGKSLEPIGYTRMNTQMDKCVQESGWTDRQGDGVIEQDLVECQNKIVKEGQKRKGNLPGGNICLPEGGTVKKRRSSISAGFDVLPSQTFGRDVSSELIDRVMDRQKSNGRKEGGKDEKDKGNDDSSVSGRHFYPSNCDHDENNNKMEELKGKVIKRRVFEHDTMSKKGKEKIKRIKVIDKTKDLEKNIQTDENNNIDEQQGTGCENKISSSTFGIADEQTDNLLLPPMTCVRTVSPTLLKNSEGKRNCKKPIRKRKINAEVKTVSLPKKSLNTCSDAMLMENPPSAVCKQMSRDANNNTKASVEIELPPITAEKESLKSSNQIPVTKSTKRTKKKGRPRTKFSPKKESKPNIIVKLEDHTDKYEVAQYTSQHKKDRNVELQLKSFERFSCLLCQGIYQYSTPDRDSMEKHLAQHLSGRLTCEECGKTFSQAIHVQEHCQREHKTANFTCEQCAHQFFNKSTLKRHLCKEHGQKLYACKKCPERYSSMIEMKNHVYEVHVGEATKCDKCGTISLSKKAAMFHSQSKTCEGQALINVPCPYCHSVLSQSQMAHHIKRIHLRIHIYKCDICPYTTLSRTALNNHTMMHQGVHPFRCELCPFSCVKSYQLSSHMRTHTGDKPYRCDQCSYAAAWNVQLKDHMRAHQSVDSIHCEECGILYRNQRCLNNHNRKVHKQKEDCNKTRKKSKS